MTQHPDFNRPRFSLKKRVFYVREQLYPENRGYLNHEFKSLEDADKFYNSKLQDISKYG